MRIKNYDIVPARDFLRSYRNFRNQKKIIFISHFKTLEGVFIPYKKWVKKFRWIFPEH